MSQNLEKLINKIKASKIPVSMIADETGLGREWVYAVMDNKIKNPGYERMMVLEQYMQKHIHNLVELQNETNHGIDIAGDHDNQHGQ